MTKFKRASYSLLIGCATAALAGCGADDIASPGEGTIVLPAPTPTATSTPTTPGTGLVTAAADCPVIAGPNLLVNAGTITGPTGTYRTCTLPARFTASTTLPKVPGVLYRMDGRVDVGTDAGPASTGYTAVLSIDPGVIIYAEAGPSFLAVNRGNQINAVGTPTSPIIFTSRPNVVGQNDDTSQGQWGGVVLLGRAPVTDCTVEGVGGVPGTINCNRETEGATGAQFGGASPADNSGRMSYVQIRYSGNAIAAGNELQSLTPSGVGSGTTIDHFQSFNSSDDGIEVFGGRPNMKYLVITGADDDSLDTDVGYKGFMQFVIAIQRPGGQSGDAMIENDTNNNENAVPRTNVRLSNFTFIHHGKVGADASAMLFRGGGDYSLFNGVVVTDSGLPCARINSATTTQTTGDDEAGPPKFTSVLLSGCSPAFSGTGTGVTTDQVAAIFNGGANNNAAFTSTLTAGFVNGTGETAAVAVDPSSSSVVDSGGFFTAAPYVGAVRNATDTWYRNWTCNSSYADFGSSGGLCTSLPTT